MSNIKALNNYKIDGDLLVSLLDVYKLIGTNPIFIDKFGEREPYMQIDCLNKSCFLLNDFFGLCSNKERIRLIITKDSEPRNHQEKSLANLKKILQDIILKANDENYVFNNIDFLDYLTMLYGKEAKINTKEFNVNNPNKKSVRYFYNLCCDEYNQMIKTKGYEPIIISSVLLLEMYNLRPYEKYNEQAFILMFYYFLLKSEINSFKYLSFFETYLKNRDVILNYINAASIHYDTGTLYFNDFVRYIIKLIKESYQELALIANSIIQEKRAYKHDNITKAIMEDLPAIFSKEDVKRFFPNSSDSTIVRALNALKEKRYITPLGSGRGAKWQRIVDKNDPIYLFGGIDENND